jgi:hypothetical protein
MLNVEMALTWPASGMPTSIPNCCCTVGSDAVASIRPHSIGGPLYFSRSGSSVDALTVAVGNFSGVPARTVPEAGGTGVPSGVTSALDTPLYALARLK